MKTPSDIRSEFVNRLTVDLIGPTKEDEIIKDRPTDRYLTGMLFPIGCRIPESEDESLALGDCEEVGAADIVNDGVPLATSFRPSSMGISFCVSGSSPRINFELSAARYQCRWVESASANGDPPDSIDDGDIRADKTVEVVEEKLTDEQGERRDERWCRVPMRASVENVAVPERSPVTIDLAAHGFPGNFQLYVQTARFEDRLGITAVLLNNNQESDDRRIDTENTLFQTEMRITPAANTRLAARPRYFQTSHLDNSDDEESGQFIYRDVKEFAVGHTCAASWSASEHKYAEAVRTEWIPSSCVEVTSASGDGVFGRLRHDSALQPLSAAWLAKADKECLVEALSLLPDCYLKWIDSRRNELPRIPERFHATANRHIEQWTVAHQRMVTAVGLIESDGSVRQAFQLANEAMQIQRGWASNGESLTWRPFQLGFQLLVLASLVDPDDPNHDVMDLLWFPTGGGKTEAYLGLIAFLIFYRRFREIRRKNVDSAGAGVTVIMRYTLRLLSTQQFERAARLICACETLRRRMPDEIGEPPVSIGLWVGSAAAANTVAEAHSDIQKRSLQIPDCPACGTRVRCPRNKSTYAIYCENRSCPLHSPDIPLPIWSVDEDIYRELPSLLIGTIDKFAQIVRKAETGKFFGLATPHHPPELILQDELHLITGPLGTVAGLYEVAVDGMCQMAGQRPKIIGSTATIRRAAHQVKALFNRRVYQFPAPGFGADNSCFAVVDKSRPGRLYLGITTAGRSPKFALQAVTASLLQSSNATSLAATHLDDYWTLITYFNSLRELGGAHVLMIDDVPKSIKEYAQRRSESPRKLTEPVELSSNLDQSDIPEVLKALGISRGQDGSIDTALATNMISVGMDIPRLALMVVNGQPKTIAEYIQATSRVGRDKCPGLVVGVFNVNKPRDRSHYEMFTTWHGTLYRDVEATSVTPFAPRAQDRALHGVLVALVRHTVRGMASSPMLSAPQRRKCAAIAAAISQRAREIDPVDGASVPGKLESLLDHWERRVGLKRYWNDRNYNANPPLMMSAETHAALVAVGKERADIWPTMNSMREVEPTCDFQLRERLSVDQEPVADALEADEEA